MWNESGGGLTYAVVTDELVAASEAIEAITDTAASAGVEGLPERVSEVGHAALHGALRDFCARWDNGLSHLVGDGRTMATRVTACVDAYVENEDESQGAYQQLFSCVGLGVDPPVPNVEPIG